MHDESRLSRLPLNPVKGALFLGQQWYLCPMYLNRVGVIVTCELPGTTLRHNRQHALQVEVSRLSSTAGISRLSSTTTFARQKNILAVIDAHINALGHITQYCLWIKNWKLVCSITLFAKGVSKLFGRLAGIPFGHGQ